MIIYHELFVVVLQASPCVLLVVVALDGDHRPLGLGGQEAFAVGGGEGGDVAVHAVPHHVVQLRVRDVLHCRVKYILYGSSQR